MWDTLAVSLSAWVLARAIGTLVGIFRTLPNRMPVVVGTGYVTLFRNIPLIVQFLVWYIVIPELLPDELGHAFKQLPPDAQLYSSSILCLGLFTAARVCEQVRSGVEALSRGQRAAGLALGLTLPQTYRFMLLPVAFRIIVPPLSSELLNIFRTPQSPRPLVCSDFLHRRDSSSTTRRTPMNRLSP